LYFDVERAIKMNDTTRTMFDVMPDTLSTQHAKTVRKVKWENTKKGDIRYLYASHDGKKYAIGPFRVIDDKKRILKRTDSSRWFFHIPEELYQTVESSTTT